LLNSNPYLKSLERGYEVSHGHYNSTQDIGKVLLFDLPLHWFAGSSQNSFLLFKALIVFLFSIRLTRIVQLCSAHSISDFQLLAFVLISNDGGREFIWNSSSISDEIIGLLIVEVIFAFIKD